MSKYVHEFELGGVRFRGRFLTPEKALDVFGILSPVINGVLEQLSPKDFDALESSSESTQVGAGLDLMVKGITAAIGAFKDLPRVAPFFHGAYQVRVGEGWRDLSDQTERNDAFGGRPSLYIGWIIAAVKHEFADFLDSKGSSTLRDLARVLGLQVQRRNTGSSGDSSSTTE